jgi:hypothetical protein
MSTTKVLVISPAMSSCFETKSKFRLIKESKCKHRVLFHELLIFLDYSSKIQMIYLAICCKALCITLLAELC